MSYTKATIFLQQIKASLLSKHNMSGNIRFIVSLTSYGERLNNTAPQVIKSLLSQSVKPDKVILWVAEEEEHKTSNITFQKLQSQGLEIRFCKDIKSYKKLIFALQEYPDDVLITADDDILYPFNWLAKLQSCYYKNPDKICCNRAHIITFDSQNKIQPYKQWLQCKAIPGTPSDLIFPTTGGGVLFPPYSLDPIVTNQELFMELCPLADDIWFWLVTKLKGTNYCVVPNGYGSATGQPLRDLQYTTKEKPLWHTNVLQGLNDKQLNNVFERFPEVHNLILQSGMANKFNSSNYWEERYFTGGNSGSGSYNKFAIFKAEVLNSFVLEHNIETIIEFGCGDGNQLKFANYPNYIGFDVSQTAIQQCKNIFTNDTHKSFKQMQNYNSETAELTLSLDVIYHLIEDNIFENYMNILFAASTKYVIIYASNSETIEGYLPVPHIKHRKFTDWITINAKDWQLIEHIPNRYPFKNDHLKGSFADFYIYKKNIL